MGGQVQFPQPIGGLSSHVFSQSDTDNLLEGHDNCGKRGHEADVDEEGALRRVRTFEGYKRRRRGGGTGYTVPALFPLPHFPWD